MNSTLSIWQRYWSLPVVEVNLLLFANLVGALMLGLLVGYERSYHSRAAGMRTYGMVCMAACALTVFAGYPGYWWGQADMGHLAPLDPTRVVQGIVTGIGFLGAGVIMRDGLNISGLTTAASIWATSAIGILVGVGFYAAAILLTLLSASLMMWGVKVETRLPALPAMGVTITFTTDFQPDEMVLHNTMATWGYAWVADSLHITHRGQQVTWQFVMAAIHYQPPVHSVFALSRLLREQPGIESLQISQARN